MLILILAAVVVSAAAPLPPPLDRLQTDAGQARAYDYTRLWEGRDAVSMQALADAAKVTGNRCPTQAETEVRAGLLSAVQEPNSEGWRQDRTMADAALRRYGEIRDALLAGTGGSGSQGLDTNVAVFVYAAKAADTPEAKELLLRTARDQIALHFPVGDAPLTAGADARLDAFAERESCTVSEDNTNWLKAWIAKRGWFEISKYGETADKAAWLIVQHSDHDPAFQERTLSLLEKLKGRGETSAKNYAYLYDRVANNAGRPQRYATQGRCVGPGDWQPFDLEDPGNVEVRRKEAGLPPLSEYRTWFRCQ